MNSKYLLLSTAALFFNSLIHGQVTMPNVVPPSPEAAAIFKFKETPVSLYSGLANVSIPLFEIETGGITLPISLSYDTRGVKVGELSSRVGTGWTLNAGGMISRQIRGRLDSDIHYGIKNTYLNSSGEFDFFSNNARRAGLYYSYAGDGQEYDFLPDQFYCTTGTGFDGKFINDYTGGPVLWQKFSDVKFIADNTIIDGNGNTYYFLGPSDFDNTLENHTFTQNAAPISDTNASTGQANTWHLSKIVTQNGKEINFVYNTETTTYMRRSHDKYDPEAYKYKSYCTKTESVQHIISEIIFDKGKVIFSYADREDIAGGKCLKSVRLEGPDGTVQRKILNHHYTESTDTNVNYYLNQKDPLAAKRLFLDSVTTISSKNDTISMPGYRFEYDTTLLPSRHSNALDLWGFYNAADNGEFLVDYNAGNREVDLVKSEAGLLKKMIYPEGGSANFHYEHNRVYSHYTKTAVYYSNPNPDVSNGISLYTSLYTAIDTLRNNAQVYNAASKTYLRKFIIPASVKGAIEYSIEIDNPANCNAPLDNNCPFKITLYNDPRDSNTPVTSHRLVYTDGEFFSMGIVKSGTYFLKVECRGDFDPTIFGANSCRIGLRWSEYADQDPEIIFAGGKRIKKIEYKDTQGTIGLVKTYDYTDPDTNLSSGILFGLPNFMGVKKMIGNAPVLYSQGNVPGSALSTYQGFSIGYGAVTEYIGQGSTTLGKSVYRYTMTPESNDFYSYPYHPPPDHEWIRGKEKKVVHYKKTGNIFEPVREIENKYIYGGETFDIDELDSSPSVFYSLPYRELLDNQLYCPDPASGEPIYLQCTNSSYKKDKTSFRLPLALIYWEDDDLKYKVFHLTGGTMDLLSTKTTDFLDSTPVKSKTIYYYDYDNHYNVDRIENVTSDNRTLETKYFYAANNDAIADQSLRLTLKNRNMLSMPLLTQTKQNSELLTSQKTIYKQWNTGTGNPQIAPELLQSSKGTGSLETRVQYVNVDPLNGNPREVRQPNGISVCYIWGYKKNQPIAKIENAVYSQIEQYEANLQLLSDGSSEASLLDALKNLRTALPNAMVTTMTYLPLIGISTITNPAGQTTKYTYDKFNRLEKVIDHEGHILSENEYYYAPQN